jgi:hypothetical protein
MVKEMIEVNFVACTLQSIVGCNFSEYYGGRIVDSKR